jgi:branched-chain amino acid transport system ATP-binding protein
MLVIEHDLDALFTLADRLTVLAMGTPIASGDTDGIRKDEKVRAAYFGTLAG